MPPNTWQNDHRNERSFLHKGTSHSLYNSGNAESHVVIHQDTDKLAVSRWSIVKSLLRHTVLTIRRAPITFCCFVIVSFLVWVGPPTGTFSKEDGQTETMQHKVLSIWKTRMVMDMMSTNLPQKHDRKPKIPHFFLPEEGVISPSQIMPDGRVLIKEGELHPIPALIRQAKLDWRHKVNKQSKTFTEAVAEYKRRYSRNPPKGFDVWYAFARAHKVKMIDEFDMIHQDLTLFRAFRPENFRAKVNFTEHRQADYWTIAVEDGMLSRQGRQAAHPRAKGVEKLIKRFAHYLPNQRLVYNFHDGVMFAIAWEERQRLLELVAAGKYDDTEAPFEPKSRGRFPQHSFPIFCPPDSHVGSPTFNYGEIDSTATGKEMPPLDDGFIGSVIGDFKKSLDLCNNPSIRHSHAVTSWVYPHHPTPVLPIFTPGVQNGFVDIHSLIVEQLDMKNNEDPSWEERIFSQLQWRGQTSGLLWDKLVNWKSTHRARLHLLSHEERGQRNVVFSNGMGRAEVRTVKNFMLNPSFLDTGMVGPAVQCVREDGTCEEMDRAFDGYEKRMTTERASLYKYLLDIDGNSWSGRFRRLMSTNGVVLKATIYPEFWTDWIMPWVHFIPIQVDYRDMWDVLAFFRGTAEGKDSHDNLAKEIAVAGKQWVNEHFRWVDLEAYQFRLMLEYGRLYNDEKEPGSNDLDMNSPLHLKWTEPVILE